MKKTFVSIIILGVLLAACGRAEAPLSRGPNSAPVISAPAAPPPK